MCASGTVRLEWLLLTTRPVESLDQALEIIAWYARRWIVEEFHKAWKTGCRAEQRRLEEADRLVPLLGALAIVAVRLLGLRDAARCDGAAPADVPATTIKILAAKLQRPAECFATNRDFLRGVARLGGFLARKSDGEPGWQTIWKGWFVLTRLRGFVFGNGDFVPGLIGKPLIVHGIGTHEQAKTAVVKTYPIAKRGGMCLIAAHMLLRQTLADPRYPKSRLKLHSAALAPAPAVVKTFFINSLIFNRPNPRKWPNPRRRANNPR